MSIKKRIKKMSKYKKSLIIFTLALLVIAEFALIYVNRVLVQYENGFVKTYMNNLILDMKSAAKRSNIDKYLSYEDISSKYEKKSSFKKGYKELFSEAKLTYEKNKDDGNKNVYDIFADDMLIARVSLDGSKILHKLGLLTFTEWKVTNIEAFNKDGIYNLDFYLTSNYDLYINGIKVDAKEVTETTKIDGLEEAYDYVKLPTVNHYKIKGLTYKPTIEVKDKDGKKVDYEIKDGKYYATNYYSTDNETEAMSKLANKFSPLEFAKKWSLFLTADLDGARYGLYELTPNLIEGTQMYKRTYSWATQVDITFTSIHTLDKETFTNAKVSNYTIYNENSFSVEVYLEKNMTLVDGQKKKDILHDVFYYVYYDGAYRLITMKSVAEDK